MNVSIADLARLAVNPDFNYYAAAEELCEEYKFERAVIVETDAHDRWARVVFHDWSALIVSDDGVSRADNSQVIDWSKGEEALVRAAEYVEKFNKGAL